MYEAGRYTAWMNASALAAVATMPMGPMNSLIMSAHFGAAAGYAAHREYGQAAGTLAQGGFYVAPWGRVLRPVGNVVGRACGGVGPVLSQGGRWIGRNLGLIARYCFPAGTLVSTEGGRKPIERLTTEDRVWSFDFREDRWRLNAVRATFVLAYDGTMATVTVGAEEIEATAGHPFWVVRGESLETRTAPTHAPVTEANSKRSGRWVLAGELRVGDELLLHTGEEVAVEQVRVAQRELTVYNISVEELENYAVGCSEVLVHNANDFILPTIRHGTLRKLVAQFYQGAMRSPGERMLGASTLAELVAKERGLLGKVKHTQKAQEMLTKLRGLEKLSAQDQVIANQLIEELTNSLATPLRP